MVSRKQPWEEEDEGRTTRGLVHFRHRATSRHHHDDEDDYGDGNDNARDVVCELDVGDNGVANNGAKPRRRRQRLGLVIISCGSIIAQSLHRCIGCSLRRRVLVLVAISFTLVPLSITLHAGGKRFGTDALSSVTSNNNGNATYNQMFEGEGESEFENNEGCTFRSYPASRLYGLSSAASEQQQQQPPQQQQQQQQQPDFLVTATYIRGKWPIILNPIEQDDEQWQTPPSKICINTTLWEQQHSTTSTTRTKHRKNETGTSMLPSRLPFTDGQNPSVVSLASEPYSHPPHRSDSTITSSFPYPRLNHRHLRPILASISAPNGSQAPFTQISSSLDELFLGAIAFGSGQCRFGIADDIDNDKSKEVANDEEGPPGGKRAVIYVLAPPLSFGNKQQQQHHDSVVSSSSSFFRTLAQSTLHLERDAKYGTSRKRAIAPSELAESSSSYARVQIEFDDPRIFFHHGRLWILYRNGPLFGYDAQIHNPLHFEQPRMSDVGDGVDDETGPQIFTAYVKASETVIIRGGRNMALISEEPIVGKRDGKVRWMPFPKLKALTWVDPVTVVQDIDLMGIDKSLWRMDVEEEEGEENVNMDNTADVERRNDRRALSERRLRTTASRSNIHGTNGYMIPLATTGELLGIAHFHRPEDRRPSQYALHGHHYTHAFFTIARDDAGTTTTTTTSSSPGGGNSTEKDTGQRYKLKRLSNEFVFRTNSIPEGMTQPPPNDGDIIQFASGLDLLGSDIDGRVIISYGINDCEGAVFTLSMQIVQQMLIMVRPGQEVVDLMMEMAVELNG